MKKYLIILALLVSFSASAQKKGFKLVETSNKGGKPSWVTENRVGYYKEQSIEMSTLKEAKDAVFSDLLSEIAMAVSSHISVTIDHSATEYIRDKGISVSEYEELVRREARIRVSRMPDFQGFTLAKGETYYERYYNKKTKEEYYNYYLLYPFSRYELDEMIEKYNAQEKMVDDRIERNRNVADVFTKTEELDAALNDLDILVGELGKEDPRISTISQVKNLIRSRYKNISIEEVENVKRKFVVRLVYDGRTIATSVVPKISSECAMQFDKRQIGEKWVVTYNDSYCYEGDNNKITIKFNIKGYTISKNIYFK